MSKDELDDFQAVRILVEALGPFPGEDRERIIRWAREKLGMPTGHSIGGKAPPPPAPPPGGINDPQVKPKDIKSFLQEKSPKSDQQLAAAVAYYFAFEANSSERKDAINFQDLIDACRKAGLRRPTNAGQTLRNSAHAGYLDKADEAGYYKLNSVGENLVAMVLSGGEASPRGRSRKRKVRKIERKKSKNSR